jgi:hypothetical protein
MEGRSATASDGATVTTTDVALFSARDSGFGLRNRAESMEIPLAFCIDWYRLV